MEDYLTCRCTNGSRPQMIHGTRELVSECRGKLSFHRTKDLCLCEPLEAVVQVKAKALIKPTNRVYRQEYVMFLLGRDGKIAHMREYFDPTQAARSMNVS